MEEILTSKLELLKLMYGQEMIGIIKEMDDHYVVDHPYFLLPHSDGILLISNTIYGDPLNQIKMPRNMVMFKTQIKKAYYERIAQKWFENINQDNLSKVVLDAISD